MSVSRNVTATDEVKAPMDNCVPRTETDGHSCLKDRDVSGKLRAPGLKLFKTH